MNSGLMIVLVLLILLAIIGAGIGLSIMMAKRAGKRGGPLAALTLPGQPQESARVGTELVAADDALREARQELDFAAAALNDTQLQQARSALAAVEEQLRQAFALKQQLDSPTVDASDKPRLTEQVYLLTAQTRQGVDEQLAALKNLTTTAGSLTSSAEQVGALADEVDRRAQASRAQISGLVGEYSEAVVSQANDALEQATQLTGLARQSLTIATSKGQAGDIAGASEPLKSAQQAVLRARGLVERIGQLPEELVAAQLSLSTTLEQARTEVKTITDGGHASDGPSADALTALNTLIARLPLSGKSADPIGDLETLRAAQASLGRATGSVGKAAMSPDQARSALSGTLMAARQHLATVDDAVAAHPAAVSADARVKAGQARVLVQQAQETAAADPVAALDLAWQADQLASAAQRAL